MNLMEKKLVQGTDIQLLGLTHLSEFSADAHPGFKNILPPLKISDLLEE